MTATVVEIAPDQIDDEMCYEPIPEPILLDGITPNCLLDKNHPGMHRVASGLRREDKTNYIIEWQLVPGEGRIHRLLVSKI